MKKITFILFALIAGTAFGQNSARSTGTADVFAEIISPISVVGDSQLNFGRLIGNSEGGNVRVDINNERTFSNPSLNAPSTGADLPQAATFKITAALDHSYSVYIPGTVLGLTGADNMPLSFEHNMAASANKGTGEAQELIVGGLLTVNPNQMEGTYQGEVSVTVAYE